MQAFLVQLMPLLQTFILGLLSIASPLALLWLRQHVKNKTAQLALEEIGATVATCVADAHQRVVSSAKDPTKPGDWTAEAAASVKADVVAEVRRLSSAAVAALQDGRGLDETTLQSLLERLVEQKVVELKSKLPGRAEVAS